MRNIWLLILAMALVTYISRALPALLTGKIELGRRTKRFLELIPYTAMAVLIFPGVLRVDAARPEIGLVGGGISAILSLLNYPLLVCVLMAIVSNILLYLIF